MHFADKKPGSQCTWSVNWLISSGTLQPRDYFPLERLSAIELIVEATDLVNQQIHYAEIRCPDKNRVQRELAPIIAAYEDGEIPNLYGLKNKIQQVRESYTSHISPWSFPTVPLYQVLTRNGWGSREEILKNVNVSSDFLRS